MSKLENRLKEKFSPDAAALARARAANGKAGGGLALNLVRTGALGEEELVQLIMTSFSLPAVNQKDIERIPKGVVRLIPDQVARKYRVVPIKFEPKEIRVLASDPTDEEMIMQVTLRTGRKVRAYCALESVVSWALLKYYGIGTETPEEVRRLLDAASSAPPPPAARPESDVPVPLVARKSVESASPEVVVEEVEQPEGAPGTPARERRERAARRRETGDWSSPFSLSRPSLTPPGDAPRREEAPREGGPRIEDEPDADEARVSQADLEEIDRLTFPEVIEDGTLTGPRKHEPLVGQAANKKDELIREIEQVLRTSKEIKFHVVEEEQDEAWEAAPECPPPPAPAAVPQGREPPPAEAARPPAPPARPSMITAGPVGVTTIRVIGNATTVAETIVGRTVIREDEVSPAAFQKKLRPSAAAQAPGTTIERVRVDRWVSFISTIDTSEQIVDRTLAFLESVFGPTVFLRRKKEKLAPLRFSPGVPIAIQEKMKRLALASPEPKELWECVEQGGLLLFAIPSVEAWQGILLLNPDAGWEEHPVALVLPLVIASAKAGALVSIPTHQWKITPELRESFAVIENTLSKAFERILIERKKKK